MKAATLIGILVAMAGITFGGIMEGTTPMMLINIPAMLIVFGGTLGATLASGGMETFKKIPALYKRAFSAEPPALGARVGLIVGFAERARRDGLLALESEVANVEDDFTRKGLQLVVDGTDPDMLREIMETEIDAMSARHHANAKGFEQASGFAPTMGVLGTVMGLVHVLGNLSQPETLGPAISGAFIATLYGVGVANIVFLPVASRLKAISEEEVEERTLLLEGIMSIQSGDNPRVVAEKLMSFVPPSERAAAEAASADPKLAAVPDAAAA
ncbi:flagellar motor protein [Paraconexibacter sp. AEG42_29]